MLKVVRGKIKIKRNVWKVLTGVCRSLRIMDVARSVGIPYTTAVDIVNKLKDRVPMSFVPKLKELNLSLLAIFAEGKIDDVDSMPFMVGSRRFIGIGGMISLFNALVPTEYINEYLNLIQERGYKPLKVVVGRRVYHWLPESELTLYDPRAEALGVDTKKLHKFEEIVDKIKFELRREDGGSKSIVDWLDIAIIQAKVEYAFEKLSKVKEFVMSKYGVPVSKQLLSYHFNRHVVSLWRYNSVRMYLDMNEVPIQAFLFEGRESDIIARLLVEMPYFIAAYIDHGSSLALGQPPCNILSEVYEIISSFDVKLPLSQLIMKGDSMVKNKVDLLEYFRDGKWVFPREKILQITP